MGQKREQIIYIISMITITVAFCLLILKIAFGVTLTDIRKHVDEPYTKIEVEYDETKEIRYKEYKEFHNLAKGYGGTRVRMYLPVTSITEDGFVTSEGITDGIYSMKYKEDNKIKVVIGDYIEMIGDVVLFPMFGNVRIHDVIVKSKGEAAQKAEELSKKAEIERIEQREKQAVDDKIIQYETKVEVVPYKASKEEYLKNIGKIVQLEGKIKTKIEENIYEYQSMNDTYIINIDNDYIQEEIEIDTEYKIMGSLSGLKEGLPRIRVIKMDKK